MRFLKRILQVLLVLVGLVLILAWYLYTKDYSGYFQSTKGRLTEVREKVAEGNVYFKKSWLTISNERGFAVECGILVPRGEPKRYPAFILLGGKTTGRHAIDYAIDIRDVILIAVDYPYEPRDSYTVLQFLKDVPAIRTALFDMVPSVMLVTDYLWQRSDVDTARVVLLGYSFGTVCAMSDGERSSPGGCSDRLRRRRSTVAHFAQCESL